MELRQKETIFMSPMSSMKADFIAAVDSSATVKYEHL